MAEGNGEVSEEPMRIEDVERTEDYQKLIEYGLDEKVAAKLDEIYKTGKLAHVDLDERALDALKEFPVDGALNVLGQFLDSNLEHVSNKSAYLCGVMKTYRQKSRAGSSAGTAAPAPAPVKGPDEEKIKQILDRTGYTLDVTTGQRKYGGPPPGWEGPSPGSGCEVFCGKIPKDMYEDELIPLFEACGNIWDLRLMMDPMTGTNRGYAFVTFTSRDAAQLAVQKLDNHEIKPGKTLKINISVPNLRLFVGNIPKSKGKEEILEEFGKLTAGLMEVIIYSSPDDKKKNRGFCFLEYESHKAASLAKRRLGTGRIKVWGCDIIVDWADPQEEPDEQTMSKVKVLYVRNLTQEITEEKLKEVFELYGKVERVKKIKDYAFIHFEDRDHAVKAMEELDSKEMGGSNIEVSLAKPPSDKKKKEEILRARERRMMQMMQIRGGMMPGPMPLRGPPGPGGPRTGSGSMRGGPMGRGDYDYDYDYYGYGDYRGGYSDPYYDDFYRYEDYYYDYQPTPTQGRGRGRQPAPELDEGVGSGVYYDVSSGTQQAGRGRGVVARGRAGGPPARGAAANRAGRGGAAGARGAARQAARGVGRAKGSLPAGKRKFDGGHQNQGDSKRRFQSNWGSQPLPQQPLGADINGEQQAWYQDSYQSWS
ncbi:heterogeneous nuclear ribonucleoprotein Q isoform X1 [Anoplophora glabripennis]|uniref:heterogeneous nuclear ribonucleoprotein Q isoform X1 n=1 Tax=Anoplophora glabripennis TaxID=217634 RepID=UPI00087424E6|nr:heterogeneous nuclear ribonucleoprotein Q isoform X1 [Anoplophora glabripennis]XP_018580132.1 heterogeneous nuclear ribonucleoprotein Q isoform X1 [Anoplophora glabripennis]XP_018580133.1 heterogeneous nuclear ribonucleoprotein Q isoform X1 [Anoplophora glabripennis]